MVKKKESQLFLILGYVIFIGLFSFYLIDILSENYLNKKGSDMKFKIGTLSKTQILSGFINESYKTVDVITDAINYSPTEYCDNNKYGSQYIDSDSSDITSVFFNKPKRSKSHSNDNSDNRSFIKFKVSKFKSGRLKFKDSKSAEQIISLFKLKESYDFDAYPNSSLVNNSVGIIFIDLNNSQSFNSSNYSNDRNAFLNFLRLKKKVVIEKNVHNLAFNTDGNNLLFADNYEPNANRRIGIDPDGDPQGDAIPVGDGMIFMTGLIGIYTLCKFFLFSKVS